MRGSRVPDLGGLIPTAGHDALAVRREGNGGDRLGMPSKFSDTLPGGGVPQRRRLCIVACEQIPALGRDGRRRNGKPVTLNRIERMLRVNREGNPDYAEA